MKIDRHGQAFILSQSEIQLLFSQGLQSDRDRALFGICLYCCCRINEACTLNVKDVYSKGRVRPELLIRKGNTKGKLATRSIPVIEDLRGLLLAYRHPEGGYLFPGRWGKGHINSDSAARILREAFTRVEIEGGSTHSFRRTGCSSLEMPHDNQQLPSSRPILIHCRCGRCSSFIFPLEFHRFLIAVFLNEQNAF